MTNICTRNRHIAVMCLIFSVLSTHAHAAVCIPERDANGRIKRSLKQVRLFKATHVCPSTGRTSAKGKCSGYVVDHIKPLCACGADLPSNMQYQTIAEAKKKDALERKLCGGD